MSDSDELVSLRAEVVALRKSQTDTEADWQAAVGARVRAERDLALARELLARCVEDGVGIHQTIVKVRAFLDPRRDGV